MKKCSHLIRFCGKVSGTGRKNDGYTAIDIIIYGYVLQYAFDATCSHRAHSTGGYDASSVVFLLCLTRDRYMCMFHIDAVCVGFRLFAGQRWPAETRLAGVWVSKHVDVPIRRVPQSNAPCARLQLLRRTSVPRRCTVHERV